MATKPHINDDYFEFKETDVITGNLLANDTAGSNGKMFLRQFDGVTVGAKAGMEQVTVIAGEYGTFYVKPDGTFDYVLSDAAKANFTNGESITEHLAYKISDGAGNTDFGYFDLKVNGVTQHPVAVDDSFYFNESSEITGNVLDNDIAGENGQLFLRRWADGSGVDHGVDTSGNDTLIHGVYGDFHVKSDGSFTYNLTTDLAAGQDVVETVKYYKISDGQGDTDVGIVKLHIHGEDAVLS